MEPVMKQQRKRNQKINLNNNIEPNEFVQQQINVQKRTRPEKITGLRIINDKPDSKEKKTVAVIVTFCSGNSYDRLFSTIEQKAMEGTKVEVYACDSLYLEKLINAFDGKPHDEVAERLMKSIGEVDPDCVVLNWECSSGYSPKNFPEGPEKLFSFLKKAVDRGHMCMFSDFSLKALVKNWNDKYELGPNPFVQTTEYTGNFVLRFNPGELKECPSAQLQTVGDMAEAGMCNVQAAGGTIVYSVDKKQLNHQIYKLQVLTVVPTVKAQSENLKCEIGEFEGNAGHVLLTYPSGGMILTSMGHWIELMKVDTSAEKVFQVAEQEFGYEKAT